MTTPSSPTPLCTGTSGAFCSNHQQRVGNDGFCRVGRVRAKERASTPVIELPPCPKCNQGVGEFEGTRLNPIVIEAFAAKTVTRPKIAAEIAQIFHALKPEIRLHDTCAEAVAKGVNAGTGRVAIGTESFPLFVPAKAALLASLANATDIAVLVEHLRKGGSLIFGQKTRIEGATLMECAVHATAPGACVCGGYHKWTTMWGLVDEKRNIYSFGNGCAHAFLKAAPKAPFFNGSFAQAIARLKMGVKPEEDRSTDERIRERTTASVPAPNKASHADKSKEANTTNVVRLPPPARPVSAVPHQWDNTTASTSRPWLPLGPVRTAHDMELERRAKEAGNGPIDLSREGAKRRVNKPGSAKRKLSAEEAARREAACLAASKPKDDKKSKGEKKNSRAS